MPQAINGELDGKERRLIVRLQENMEAHELLGGGCSQEMVRLNHVIMQPCRKRSKLDLA